MEKMMMGEKEMKRMMRIKMSMPDKRQMHGSYDEHMILAAQGAKEFKQNPGNFELGNPLTASGREVMSSMRKEYGEKKGKQVFYSSINAGKKGSSSWHK